MANYTEQLNKANKGLETVEIHGKGYVPVNQRVLAFWSLFPDGRIETIKLMDNGERCDFVCNAYRNHADEKPISNGYAYEIKKGGVNATSYIENAETSAVGRALGFLGIGATSSIASAEEVENAVQQQEEAEQLAKMARKRKPKSEPESEKSGARQALEAIRVDYSGLQAAIEKTCKGLYGDEWEAHVADEKAKAWEHVKDKSQAEVDKFVESLNAVEFVQVEQ